MTTGGGRAHLSSARPSGARLRRRGRARARVRANGRQHYLAPDSAASAR